MIFSLVLIFCRHRYDDENLDERCCYSNYQPIVFRRFTSGFRPRLFPVPAGRFRPPCSRSNLGRELLLKLNVISSSAISVVASVSIGCSRLVPGRGLLVGKNRSSSSMSSSSSFMARVCDDEAADGCEEGEDESSCM